ncbi:MAG: restriction endonuclease, SacI family [Duncaniella sp.]|uniref:restriction endonuclease, SacI family n=1 Tax=Duncaniella sp. TaxID=2518496 RepID=UPI0023C4B094|nr:restriction endonuclease, SacI family [Duncaniella sp.]MDE5988855.1 restriction endonuclease, SacI family [Duncaniella sp.]
MPNIDFKTASLILERAWVEAKEYNDPIADLITKVLNGTHKTYRYILVTGLLAKATNESVNALSLQKGDGTNGKYDARSLCHNVVVPFETMKLQGCLGNSNEPFLNKPARFVMLSLDNAVRRGKDYQTLSDVIDILSTITDSQNAYRYLKHALSVMVTIHESYIAKYSVGDSLIDVSEFAQLVLDYIYKITEHSFEGEICPLVVAQLEQMYLGKDYRVEAHKVNQSGSSSKEIGDIDVYDNANNLVKAIEVKDKNFSEQDVVHAIDKFRAAHLTSSMFIYGKNVVYDKDAIFHTLKSIGREGHYCCLISILNYAKLRISDLKIITVRQFVDGLLVFAKAINAKDDTISAIKEIAKQIF